MPLISIITINLNNLSGLQKTMSSVLAQKGADYEYIVIDGDSTDGSKEYIAANSDKLIHWVSEKDKGIFSAQNKGAGCASGKYLLFLNSGDVLESTGVLKKFGTHLEQYDLVYGDLLVDNGTKQELVKMPDQPDVYYFMTSSLAHPATFISTHLFRELGGYREDMKVTGDYEFFLRAVLKHGASFIHISFVVAVFNSSGLSSDPAFTKLQEAERRKSWELNFSQLAIGAFEGYTRLLRSTEMKVGKMIKKVINPFKP